jgi:L-serine kinase (ADP)
MRRTGYQRDPILVDGKTKLALDGMHRIRSLKSLGANFAVCSEYQYFSRGVKLERWIRTIVGPGPDLISRIRSKFSMETCSGIESAVEKVDGSKSGIALLSGQTSYYGGKQLNHMELYKRLGEVDELCENRGVNLEFVPESEKLDLYSSAAVATLYPAKLTKRDVLESARNRRLLPYKTTRHVVPLRPMGIYFPIDLLRNGSISDCKKELERIVKFSKVIVERKNIWYEGRRYSERIAVFKPIKPRQSENYRQPRADH